MNKYKDIKEKFEEIYETEVGHADVCKRDGYNLDGTIVANCVCGCSELWNFILKEVIPMVEKKTRKEIDGIVDVVLGYIEDEKEYKAAKSRWETLKSK